MNLSKLFLDTLNDQIKKGGASIKVSVLRDNTDKATEVDLSNLKIVSVFNAPTGIKIENTSDNKVVQAYNEDGTLESNYNLNSSSQLCWFLTTIIRRTKQVLYKEMVKRTKVWKIGGNFYLLPQVSGPQYANRPYVKINSYTRNSNQLNATLSLIETSDGNFFEYSLIRDNFRGAFELLDTAIPIYTQPYDLADLDLNKCDFHNLTKVFVHRNGVNYGSFAIAGDEEQLFHRCTISKYLTTNLSSYFNELVIQNGDKAYTSYQVETAPSCTACNKVDFDGKNIQVHGTNTFCNECATDFKKVMGDDLSNYDPKKYTIIGAHDNPSLKFSKYESEITPLYLGVELEVDTQHEASDDDDNEDEDFDGGYTERTHTKYANMALQTISADDYLFVKRDGSLSSGFEMVSHPLTLSKHTKTMHWKEGFDLLTKLGYKSHNAGTCGLHIHINRDFFGTPANQMLGGAKLSYLMEKNWDAMMKFTRRTQYQLDRWARKGDTITRVSRERSVEVNGVKKKIKPILSSAFRYAYPRRNKYVALNTIHRATFEFRIFRGTLNHETFMATLQLVDNMARIVKDIPNDDNVVNNLDKINFEDIINYRPYNELTSYWAKRKAQ